MDRGSDTAFSGAIEFGDDESAEGDGLLKFTGLIEGVAAGRGIDDEKGFVGRGLVLLADGSFDLGKLLHQVVAGVKPACGVTDQEVTIFADRSLVGLVADRGWIGLVRSGDDGEIEALAPADELLDGRSAKGVGGGKKYGVALALEEVSELGRGRRFAGAIDAHDEDHGGLAIGPWFESRGVSGEEAGKLGSGGLDDIVGGDLASQDSQLIDNFQCESDAEVAGNEVGLEIVPVDFGFVSDLVKELLEKTSHGGRMLGEDGDESQGINDC